jgi:hypothetical protein
MGLRWRVKDVVHEHPPPQSIINQIYDLLFKLIRVAHMEATQMGATGKVAGWFTIPTKII